VGRELTIRRNSPVSHQIAREEGETDESSRFHFQLDRADTSSAKEIATYDLSDPHHGDWVQFHRKWSAKGREG
jgi:hypothetical protein